MSATHHAGCVKRAYPSRAHALLDMDRIREVIRQLRNRPPAGKNGKRTRRTQRQHPDMPCRAYLCQHCGAWHLTSQQHGRAA